MGNAFPSLIASGARIAIIAIPAIVLSRTPGFQLHTIWYLSMAAVFVQLLLSMSLLSREFGRRLNFSSPHAKAA
jgi:hypothetical protein